MMNLPSSKKLKDFLKRNKKLNSHLYDDEMVLGKDYIVCPITNVRLSMIRRDYVEKTLGLSFDYFLSQYPNTPLMCSARLENIRNSLKKIGEDGLTAHQRSVVKSIKSRSVVGEDGLTVNARKGKKIKATHLSKIDQDGNNGYHRIAKYRNEKILDNGFTVQQNACLLGQITREKRGSKRISGASKSSKKALLPILTFLDENHIKYYFDKPEYGIQVYSKYFYYDLVIPELSLAIEYNGKNFHPDPFLSKIERNFWRQTYTGKTADEVDAYDYFKSMSLKIHRGFEVHNVWEKTQENDVLCLLDLIKLKINSINEFKFIKNEDYEILTPDGWKDFEGTVSKGISNLIRLDFKNKQHVEATSNHTFFKNGEKILVKDIKIGDVLDGTQSAVIKITNVGESIVWDIAEVDGDDHSFLINGGIHTKNCDEFAFVPPNKAKDFWTSIQPVLSCVSGDTLVLTNNGFSRIIDFHQNRKIGEYFDIKNTLTFGKNGLEPISHGYVSPESDTLIIETEHGYQAEVTKKHPLFSLQGNKIGMCQASELRKGDALRIQMNMQIFGADHKLNKTSVKEITPELGYILGGFIAEGWISKGYRIEISNTDLEFRDKYINSSIIKPFKSPPSNPNRLQCCSKELQCLLEEMGVDPKWKCDTKQIPDRIFRSSKEIQAAFLRGYFDGDGSSSGNVINLTSTSKKLLQEVQILLSNFGIFSNIGKLLPGGRTVQTARDSYSLIISRSCFELFQKEIGFGISRKQKVLEENSKKFIQGTLKNYIVPKNDDLIFYFETLLKRSKKTAQWFRKNGCRLDKALRYKKGSLKAVLTQEWLIRFKNLLNETLTDYDIEIFNNLIGDFYWDRIKSITPSKNKTYDFTVPETHSFLQNGLLGSNTGGSCIITSTPKSDEDQFAQIWRAAIDNVDEYGNFRKDHLGKNGFYAVKVPWSEHPERDEAWAAPFRESLGEARFRQEFECDFVTDDETLINPLTLSQMKGINPDFYTNNVRWYMDPIPNKTYLVSLDPSLGTGRDYAAIQVFQLPEMIQVAEWQHNNTAPRGQVSQLMKILMFIEQTMRDDPRQMGEPEIFWTIENNTIGEAILQIIEDTGEERFPGIFVSEKKRKGQTRRFRKGLNTDNKKKLSACARAKSLIESGRMLINSDQLIKELKMFVAVETTFKAKPGAHDDLVMAMLLAVRMLDTVLMWSNSVGDLKEHIDDDELYEEIEGMPVVI